MGLSFNYRAGETPLDLDEAAGLIPALSLQSELDEFEQLNITESSSWALKNRRLQREILSSDGLVRLHKRMFGQTWRWAGKFRLTQKSIGIESYRIPTELQNLTEDVKAWLTFGSYPPAEIVARFHHRLVSIHPFPNGNGRHARLSADVFCQGQAWSRSAWGMGDLGQRGDIRARYIAALKSADRMDYHPLLRFMNLEIG